MTLGTIGQLEIVGFKSCVDRGDGKEGVRQQKQKVIANDWG